MKKSIFGLITISVLFFSCSKNSPIPPVASFSYSGEGLAPSTVIFNNTSTNAANATYAWDFGDNSTSTVQSPSHTYAKGGVFTARLTVTTADGNSTVSKTINITSPTSVKINSIKITSLSFTDPSCSCGWDSNSGPDVYILFTDNTNNVLLTGAVIDNVAALPLMWNANAFQITNLTSTYKIYIYDKDTNDFPPSADDLMQGFSFSFSSLTTYPATWTLQDTNGVTKIEFSLTWQ